MIFSFFAKLQKIIKLTIDNLTKKRDEILEPGHPLIQNYKLGTSDRGSAVSLNPVSTADKN